MLIVCYQQDVTFTVIFEKYFRHFFYIVCPSSIFLFLLYVRWLFCLSFKHFNVAKSIFVLCKLCFLCWVFWKWRRYCVFVICSLISLLLLGSYKRKDRIPEDLSSIIFSACVAGNLAVPSQPLNEQNIFTSSLQYTVYDNSFELFFIHFCVRALCEYCFCYLFQITNGINNM